MKRFGTPLPSTSRAGFSLIEMILVVTIMVIMVGVAVPVTSKVLAYKARLATTEELGQLSSAAVDHFYDTWALPTSADDLLVDPGSVPGWSGPYLPGVVADRLTGQSGYQVDAWSRPYDFLISGDVLTITSQGADAQVGSADDVEVNVDVTPIRREETLRRLLTINQAITIFNGINLPGRPLPPNYVTIQAMLVGDGLLPSTATYSVDGWGDAFVPDPPGISPVVRVGSSNLGSQTQGGPGRGGGRGRNRGRSR